MNARVAGATGLQRRSGGAGVVPNQPVQELGPVAGVSFWLASVLVIGATAGALVLNATGPVIASNTRVAQLGFALEPLWYVTIGAFLVVRRPRNLTAWALWLGGASIASETLAQGVLSQFEAGRRVPLAAAIWANWLNNWTWVAMFTSLILLLLRFPDGALPSPRWRWVQRLALTAQVTSLVVSFIGSEDSDHRGIPAPLGLSDRQLPAGLMNVVGLVVFLTLIGGIVSTAIGLLIRYRRAHGTQRAQLQWLLASAGLVAVLFIATVALQAIYGGEHNVPAPLLDIGETVLKLSLLTVPVAVAVAVTRHGLFEIGRIVSRTVSYSLVVVLLGAAYVGVVTSLSALVPDRLGALPVVAATLAASALFVPLRRRAIRLVDRRFNRARYDAEALVARFAERTRGRAGHGSTTDDLLSAAQQALQPAHASVWLVPQPVPIRPAGDGGAW